MTGGGVWPKCGAATAGEQRFNVIDLKLSAQEFTSNPGGLKKRSPKKSSGQGIKSQAATSAMQSESSSSGLNKRKSGSFPSKVVLAVNFTVH